MLAVLVALSTAAAQSTDEAATQATEREWLIMGYFVADNNLEGAEIDDMNSMEQGLQDAIDEETSRRIAETEKNGTKVTDAQKEEIKRSAGEYVTAHTTIVVQIDRSPEYDTSNGDWNTTRRYVIKPGTKPGEIESEMVEGFDKEVNMGDPDELVDFVNWAQGNYSASNTMLILRNHGSGWKYNEKQEKTRETAEGVESVGFDDTDGDALTPLELKYALSQVTSSGEKIDVLGFDACLMQMVEHSYEYKDYVSIIVGSEEISYTGDWDYAAMAAKSAKGGSPEDLATNVVDNYKLYPGSTISAIKTDEVVDMTNKLDALLKELDTVKDSEKVLKAYKEVIRFRDSEYGDLYTFANNIERAKLGANVTAAAKALKDSIDGSDGDGAVIKKRNGSEKAGAGGVSIWMPLEDNKTNFANYSSLGVSDSTSWDETITNEVKVNQAQKTSGQIVGYDQWWRH